MKLRRHPVFQKNSILPGFSPHLFLIDLKVAACALVADNKIAVVQRFGANGFALAWGMDELSVADIDTHVGNTIGAAGSKKDQIAGLQGLPGHRPTGTELIPGVAGKIQSIETINGHGQTAAVKPFLGRGASPAI
jgi:hypothetical protein